MAEPTLNIGGNTTGNDFTLNDLYTGNDAVNAVNTDITVLDESWITSRFMVPDSDLMDILAKSRYYSSATSKYTDSTIGGNIYINPRPQFTRYCDIRTPGRINREKVTVQGGSNIGMGRYYSEAIDDNQQIAFMEFGIPKFNGLTDFFFRAISYEDSVIANTGRSTIAYKVGSGIGTLIMLAAFPILTVAISVIKIAKNMLLGQSSFKYYHMEPTMHTYWGVVNQIVSQLAVEMGILAPEFDNLNSNNATDPNTTTIGYKTKIDRTQLDLYRELLPGVINDSNYIDVFAIATRAQTRANRKMLAEYEESVSGDETSYLSGDYKRSLESFSNTVDIYTTFEKYLDDTVRKESIYTTPKTLTPDKGGKGVLTDDEIKAAVDANATGDNKFKQEPDGTYKVKKDADKESYANTLVSAIDSSVRQGGAYAAFGINYKGSVSESFNNSIGTISTGENAKAIARKAKNVKFDFAGGNLIDGIGIDKAMGYVKDLASGTLDSITMGLSSVLTTAFGGGYIEMPKRWEDSSSYFPTITYSMSLISPYGNTISQLQNIYIPLAMLLAGSLPLATGKSSYTSPFLCSLFVKGIQKVEMGMITNLNITRGTSNLGFDKERRPLAIDVSFTVTDFSTMITSPVNPSIFATVFNAAVADDTPFGTYMGVLGGRKLLTNKYLKNRIKLNLSKALMGIQQFKSASGIGMLVGDSNLLQSTLGALVNQRSLTAGN